MSHFEVVRQHCKVESFYTTGREQKDAHNVNGICGQCNTVFEAMGWFYQYCAFQKTRLSTDGKIQRSVEKRVRRTTKTLKARKEL